MVNCGDKEMANVGDKGNETNIKNMIAIKIELRLELV